jgi:NADH dehydrogenase
VTDPIVVIGGGFAGFWAALAARRVGAGHLDVVLVSRDPMLQIRPRLYEVDPETLQVDLLPLLQRADVAFLAGDATGLDVAGGALVANEGGKIPYARLVVATGSAMRRPDVPGAAAAFSIDTVADAIAFDRHLVGIARHPEPPKVIVVGAGFTGIELALELRDRIARHSTHAQAECARIILLDRAPVVGSRLGSRPRPIIEQALSQARIDVQLGVTITELGSRAVRLATGETLFGDAVVLTTGMVAAAFADCVPGERDSLGRVLVDRSLRAPAAPDVFVAGDAAAADGGDGHPILQSCQHALQLGRYAGENAARDVLGLPVVAYAQPPYITCLDLGRSGAVFTRGWERTVDMTGARAKAAKRRINTEVIYPPANATRDELLGLSRLDPIQQRSRTAQSA